MAIPGKPMTSGPDIYRTANLLVCKYGEMAPMGAIIDFGMQRPIPATHETFRHKQLPS